MYNFDPYNVFLTIATNIPVLLMTASVLQGHIYIYYTHTHTHTHTHIVKKQQKRTEHLLPHTGMSLLSAFITIVAIVMVTGMASK